MTLDGAYTATIDRIVGESAVVLVEDGGDVAEELTIPVERLPDGAGEGAVLDVVLSDGSVESISSDGDETERRKRELQDRFDRLSERPPGRDEEE